MNCPYCVYFCVSPITVAEVCLSLTILGLTQNTSQTLIPPCSVIERLVLSVVEVSRNAVSLW